MIDDPTVYRQHILQAWQNKQNSLPLDRMQQQIVDVIEQHPEYHNILNQSEIALNETYRTDNNPFLHIALHLSLNEQISMDRPAGIRALWEQACQRKDPHDCAHQCISIMADMLWDAQHNKVLISDEEYYHQLKRKLSP